MRRNSIVFVLAFGITLTGLFAAWKHLGNAAGPSMLRLPGEMTGTIAPDFDLESLNGTRVHLSDYRGKAVVLNFWTCSCVPCRAEMAVFTSLQEKFGPDGLRVIGINLDHSAETSAGELARISRELNINYAILLGNNEVAAAYGGLRHIPATFYVARDGTIVGHSGNIESIPDVEKNIRNALKQKLS